MIKINVSFSKKVPGEEQYSSLNFHGSLERELSDSLSANDIHRHFQENYKLLEHAVEQEIRQYTAGHQQRTAAPQLPSHTTAPAARSSRPVQAASQKQITFINRLGAEQGMTQAQVDDVARSHFAVASIWEVNKQQASQLIEQLQKQRAA